MSLPEGLKFLEFGWWVVHLLTIPLVFVLGYRKGRDDEREATAHLIPRDRKPSEQ